MRATPRRANGSTFARKGYQPKPWAGDSYLQEGLRPGALGTSQQWVLNESIHFDTLATEVIQERLA